MQIVMHVGNERVKISPTSELAIQECGESAVLAGDTVTINGSTIVYVYSRVGYGLIMALPGHPIDIYRE